MTVDERVVLRRVVRTAPGRSVRDYWPLEGYSSCSQFKNNYFTDMCSGSEKGSFLKPIDLCINSRLESNTKEEEEHNPTHRRAHGCKTSTRS